MLTIFTQILNVASCGVILRDPMKSMLTRMHAIMPEAIHCTSATQAHSRSMGSDNGIECDEKTIEPDILYDVSGTVYGTDILPQRVVFQMCFVAGLLVDVLCKKVHCIDLEMQF